MCKPDELLSSPTETVKSQQPTSSSSMKQRRGKRDKKGLETFPLSIPTKKKVQSRSLQKHGNDAPSGGIEALLPSLIGVVILVCGVMAKMGFRGRASVAGIDLGTTNSVICIQSLAKGVGEIECIPDPATGSPIIPSVVSFLDPSERKVGPSSKVPSLLHPHPSTVVVGSKAKRRIDSHPHHTLYNAKRVLGRDHTDPAIAAMRSEVEFTVQNDPHNLHFRVPDTPLAIPPQQVGSYVVHHLIQITKTFLGHDNIKSAVICVPAKFTAEQRRLTGEAFRQAGIAVARVVEEPTAAALAYGLHRKEGVDYILVYDFGGGTLDISLLHVSEGFVDVMGSDGDDVLGGADFDAAVANFLLKRHGGQDIVDSVAGALGGLERTLGGMVDLEQVLADKCPVLKETPLCTASSFHTIGEQLKISLSDFVDISGKVSRECLRLKTDLSTANLGLEQFCSALEPVSLEITTEEYNVAVQNLLDRSILPVDRLLFDLGLTPKDIDDVVMVGGTTRMPQIRQLVQKALPHSLLNTRIDPDLTVAYGAASVID